MPGITADSTVALNLRSSDDGRAITHAVTVALGDLNMPQPDRRIAERVAIVAQYLAVIDNVVCVVNEDGTPRLGAKDRPFPLVDLIREILVRQDAGVAEPPGH